MKHLFSPFRICEIELKNRIVLPALASFLLEDDGIITDKTVNHYQKRAAGGPAMVFMEACAVSAEGIVSRNQSRIFEQSYVGGLANIAKAIKSEGAIPAVQLHHAGRQTSAKVIRQQPSAPSCLPCRSIRGDVKQLSINQIQELIAKFGAAANRAREAGFELIEIHGAHGYLVNQFLSGYSNIREDRYGGGLKGRARFAVEIVRELRKRLGPDFPLSFKISAREFVPNGLTLDESFAIINLLIEAGINVVQVSAGNDATPEWICQPMFMPKACLTDLSEAIRRKVAIPVMAVGRINDPFTADQVLSHGKADLVCMGRALMADPQLPKKAKAGNYNAIRPCIGCNSCMESIFRNGRLECLVNPVLCHETEMSIRPTATPKKVMVVGGGPSGMTAAWIAAKRGHQVHMFEQGADFGGMLTVGGALCYKNELVDLIRWFKYQIQKYGVQCHLGQSITATTVKRENPDIVILATGSVPLLPDIDGIKSRYVVSIDYFLNKDADVHGLTVIVGGGTTGCELAIHISEAGGRVIVVEISDKICSGLESVTKKVLLRKLNENDVKILTQSQVTRIKADGVFIIDDSYRERYLEAKRVVIATGNKSNNSICQETEALGYEIHFIGDCLRPRTAKAAIYEGFLLGLSI